MSAEPKWWFAERVRPVLFDSEHLIGSWDMCPQIKSIYFCPKMGEKSLKMELKCLEKIGFTLWAIQITSFQFSKHVRMGASRSQILEMKVINFRLHLFPSLSDYLSQSKVEPLHDRIRIRGGQDIWRWPNQSFKLTKTFRERGSKSISAKTKIGKVLFLMRFLFSRT